MIFLEKTLDKIIIIVYYTIKIVKNNKNYSRLSYPLYRHKEDEN